MNCFTNKFSVLVVYFLLTIFHLLISQSIVFQIVWVIINDIFPFLWPIVNIQFTKRADPHYFSLFRDIEHSFPQTKTTQFKIHSEFSCLVATNYTLSSLFIIANQNNIVLWAKTTNVGEELLITPCIFAVVRNLYEQFFINVSFKLYWNLISTNHNAIVN